MPGFSLHSWLLLILIGILNNQYIYKKRMSLLPMDQIMIFHSALSPYEVPFRWEVVFALVNVNVIISNQCPVYKYDFLLRHIKYFISCIWRSLFMLLFATLHYFGSFSIELYLVLNCLGAGLSTIGCSPWSPMIQAIGLGLIPCQNQHTVSPWERPGHCTCQRGWHGTCCKRHPTRLAVFADSCMVRFSL